MQISAQIERIKRDNKTYPIETNFCQAMKQSKHFDTTFTAKSSGWRALKDRYNSFICRVKKNIQTAGIPKIVHHIWLGSELPEKNKQLRKTWHEQHPDWTFILWTDKDIEAFGLQNIALYNATTNYGEKSDIARYEILYRMGGLYVDTDFECFMPFDLFHAHCDFFAGVSYEKYVNIYNGLIGSIPGHPILKQCIDAMQRKKGAKNTFAEIMNRTGPFYFTRQIYDYLLKNRHDANVTIFPVSYLYPWPNYLRNSVRKEHVKRFLQPHSYALHHWEVSWNGGKTT